MHTKFISIYRCKKFTGYLKMYQICRFYSYTKTSAFQFSYKFREFYRKCSQSSHLKPIFGARESCKCCLDGWIGYNCRYSHLQENENVFFLWCLMSAIFRHFCVKMIPLMYRKNYIFKQGEKKKDYIFILKTKCFIEMFLV